SFGDETMSQLASGSSERPMVCCPKRDVAAGSRPHMTKETQALLRLRLRASAVMFLTGFGIFLIRHVAGGFTGEPLLPALLGLHVVVVVVMSVIAAPFWWHSELSIKKLRMTELVIFGLPAAFFLMLEYYITSEGVSRSVRPPPLPFWLLLIFTYGMF